MLICRPVPHLPPALYPGHRQLGFIAIGAAAALGFACYSYFRPRADANDIERRRRLFLAEYGRITDASLIDSNFADSNLAYSRRGDAQLGDTNPSDAHLSDARSTDRHSLDEDEEGDLEGDKDRQEEPVPSVLIYTYRVSGVSYECAQDVSLLAEHVRHVRIDLPIQVRYDPHNPSNSIVVSESWSGLRLDPHQH
jgi:hypothetical protein